MKTIVRTLALVLLFSISSVLKATDQETANIIGHAMSSISIGLNDLSQSDYCLLKTTVENQGLSYEQKSSILNGDAEVNAFLDIVITNVAIINNNNATAFIEDATRKNLVVEVIDHDFDQRALQGGPCSGFDAQRLSCNADYVQCGLIGYAGCLLSGPLYGFCAASVAIGCTGVMLACHNSNATAHPGCTSGMQAHIDWHPWIGSDDESHNCTE